MDNLHILKPYYKNEKYLGLRKIKFEEYDNCNHILIYSKIKNDSSNGYIHSYQGCIKCGLDESVIDKNNLTHDEQIKYDYLKCKGIRNLHGIKIDVDEDLSIVQKLYMLIKKEHPTISDDIVVQYLEYIMNNAKSKVKQRTKNS